MGQTLSEYKFFTDFKLTKGKTVDGKANFQLEFPGNQHVVNCQLKKALVSEKESPLNYEFKYMFSPRKWIKTGISIDQKKQVEVFYQHDRIRKLLNCDFCIALSNKNGMVKLNGKKGKLRYEVSSKFKPFDYEFSMIGFRLSYNMDYNSDRRVSQIKIKDQVPEQEKIEVVSIESK